jgi:hypothetical protein
LHSFNLPLPYSVQAPFLIDFSGAKGETHTIWKPQNATFWLGALTIRGNVAADLNVCDSDPALPVGFISLSGSGYDELNIGVGLVKSTNTTNSRLLLMDPVGVVMSVKGVVYGYEVTPEGAVR